MINPLKSVNRIIGMSSVFAGGFYKAHKINAFSSTQRDVLPRYINVFSRKLSKVFDIQVEAVNKIPQHHALWVSNHVSWLDIPVLGSVCPAFFIAKAEVRKMPLIGSLAEAAGTMFIKRGSGDAGSVSDQLEVFLRDQHPVVFFPEGTTTNGEQIKKLHGKLLQSSIGSGIPVQPVVICYVNDKQELDTRIPFVGDISFPVHLFKMFYNKPLTAYVMALDAIDPSGHDQESLRALLQDNMQQGLAALHRQVLA